MVPTVGFDYIKEKKKRDKSAVLFLFGLLVLGHSFILNTCLNYLVGRGQKSHLFI